MPTHGSSLDCPAFYRLITKWTRHFDKKGVSHSKVFKLARKHALKEFRG